MNKIVVSTLLTLSLSAFGCAGSETESKEPMLQPGSTTPAEDVAVNAIPEGMHSANPHLVVDDVAASLSFYETAFSGKKGIELAGPDGSLMHAEITIGDTLLMIAAAMPATGSVSPKSASGTNGSLYYYVSDVDTATKAAVDAGAKQIQAPTDMFYGDRVSTIEDPAGHRWMLATHVEEVDQALLKERSDKIAASITSKTGMPAFERKTPAKHYRSDMARHDITMSLVVKSGKEAIDFYQSALGAKEIYRSAMPDGRLMHAVLSYGDSYFFITDAFPEMPGHDYYKTAADLGGNTLNLMLYSDDVDSAFATAGEAGGTSKQPITKMFWGDRYGSFVDPSGIQWGIATHVENVAPEELPLRMKEWMQEMQNQQGDLGENKAEPGVTPVPGEDNKAVPANTKK